MGPNELVSVVVPTYNRSQKLLKCLEALLLQSYTNIEIIVADDNSADETVAVVSELLRRDRRIRLVRNPVNGGASAARNLAIREAHGELIFFTDDDVLVPRDWIEAGLRAFSGNDCVGVEGRIVYVSDTYRPRYSDRVVGNGSSGQYMTANMAYRKDVIIQAGLFDESFRVMHDRDLALRVLKYGRIAFSKEFTVSHMLERLTLKSYFHEAKLHAGWVQFNIVNNQKNQMIGFVYRPTKLLALLFPPIILGNLFSARFESPFDYFLLLLLYPRLWYERFQVWRWAVRYKKFVI